MAVKDSDEGKPEADEADVSLDMSQAAVRKMIADARERGYITMEQLNTVMPPDQVSSEQIEDIMSMLSEMGINVVEDDEGDEAEAPVASWSRPRTPRARWLWSAPRPRRWTAPTTRCGCICGKWARSNCCRAKAKSPSPSGSRLAATR